MCVCAHVTPRGEHVPEIACRQPSAATADREFLKDAGVKREEEQRGGGGGRSLLKDKPQD